MLTYFRRPPMRHESLLKTWLIFKLIDGIGPFPDHKRRQHIAAFGNFYGRLKQISKGQFAKFLVKLSPACYNTGYCDRVPTALGLFCKPLTIGSIALFKVIGVPCHGRRTRSI